MFKRFEPPLYIGLFVLSVTLLTAVSCSGPNTARDRGVGETWTEERSVLDRAVETLLEAERYGEVIVIADSLTAGGVGDIRILAQKAYALGALGRFGESVGLYEKVLIEDYSSCENHLNFGVFLMRMGKFGRAITEFKEAMGFCNTRNRAMIHRNVAVANLKLGRRTAAMSEVELGLRTLPDDPYLAGLKAMLIAGSDPAAAESLFVKARKEAGASPDFLCQFGMLLLKDGRTVEAAEVLEEALRLRPGDREAAYNLALALIGSKRPGEAEALLRGLSDTEPGDEVSLLLAKALFRQDRFDEALGMYREAPPTPETMDRIAMCYHGLGDLDGALEWAAKAVEARPDWPVALINMSVIRAARGELDEAEYALERVIELDPENLTARINLQRIRSEREQRNE